MSRNDESTKTRIETLLIVSGNIHHSCRNDESTKTRIETYLNARTHYENQVVMTNPLKQGLKHSIGTGFVLFHYNVVMTNPLKQGLKHRLACA